MPKFSPAITRLVSALGKLPGIGSKSAQRLCFHLLTVPAAEAEELAYALLEARKKVRLCSVCCNLTDTDPCPICSSEDRDRTKICVLESPSDVAAMERSGTYDGLYHVLHGSMSPMKGIGPEDIRLAELFRRLQNEKEVNEIIIATNSTVEGEATASYIARLIKPSGIKVSRIAHGIPMGSSLEYADEMTLAQAIENRRLL